jgi:tetratricopeptide (TPR) repeat protein
MRFGSAAEGDHNCRILTGRMDDMTQVTIDQALRMAREQHGAGRLPEAESIYRQILSHHPNNPQALYGLGLLAYQVGHKDALELMQRALSLWPDFAEGFNNFGNVLQSAGRLDAAISAFQRALQLRPDFPEALSNMSNALHIKGMHADSLNCALRAVQLRPDYAEAHNNCGIAFQSMGKLPEAIESYRKAISVNPKFAEPYSNMAVALIGLGRNDEAIPVLRRALEVRPVFPEVYNNLGNALQSAGNLEGAMTCFRQAIAQRPEFAEALSNLGNALQASSRYDEAIVACRQALAIKPEFPDALNNLGISLQALGHIYEAADFLRRALAGRPQFPEALSNLGVSLQCAGRLQEAEANYRASIVQRPAYAEAHFNLSLILLLTAQWEEGWKEYEWRWRVPSFPSLRRTFKAPMWDGSAPPTQPMEAGNTILLHAEQGIGDTIQFIQFVPEVARRGWRVILECQSELRRMLEASATELGAAVVAERLSADGRGLPPFDYHLPLASLPFALGIRDPKLAERLRDPYVKADPRVAARWKDLTDAPGKLKVGLVWAGSPTHKDDLNRSVTLDTFKSLVRPNVKFFSLQLGKASQQAKTPPPGMDLVDLTDRIGDFADTAALMSHLDLIITVDTAVGHLGGAMAKPTFVLIAFMPDFRWTMNGEDTPWYTTLRLFRQTTRNDWPDVMVRVNAAMDAMLESRGLTTVAETGAPVESGAATSGEAAAEPVAGESATSESSGNVEPSGENKCDGQRCEGEECGGESASDEVAAGDNFAAAGSDSAGAA